MAKNDIKITLTGDASDAVKAFKDMQAEERKHIENIAKAKDATKSAAQEARQHQRVAAKAFRDTATETEKARKELDELNRAFEAGKLDVTLYDRAVSNLERRMGKAVPMGQRMAGAVDEMKRSLIGGAGLAGSFASGLQAIGPAGGAAVAAITAVVTAAKRGLQVAREFDRQEASTSAQIDRSASRIIRQSGRPAGDRQAIIDSMLGIANDTAFDVGKTAQVIETGYSVGLGAVDRNGIGQALITGIQAMNLEDGDPVQVVEMVAALAKNFGQTLNKDNVRDIMQRIHGTFGEGVVQLSQMGRLVENAGMLAATGETFGSSLALQASFQEIASPDKVRTALQNYMKATQVDIPTQKGKREAIEALGLSPDDLKLGNQSVAESMGKLAGALDTAGYSTDQRTQLIGTVFGGENASTVMSMLGQVTSGDVGRRLTMQRDTGAYDRAATAFRSDLMAGQTRREIEQIRTDVRDAVNATRQVAIEEALDDIEQRAYQQNGDGLGSTLGKAATWASARYQGARAMLGGGENFLSMYDAANGTDYMSRIEGSVRARDPNAAPFVPQSGGAAFGESILDSMPIVAVMRSLIGSMDANTEATNRLAGQSANTPASVGTAATAAPVNDAPVMRQETPVTIMPQMGATP